MRAAAAAVRARDALDNRLRGEWKLIAGLPLVRFMECDSLYKVLFWRRLSSSGKGGLKGLHAYLIVKGTKVIYKNFTRFCGRKERKRFSLSPQL